MDRPLCYSPPTPPLGSPGLGSQRLPSHAAIELDAPFVAQAPGQVGRRGHLHSELSQCLGSVAQTRLRSSDLPWLKIEEEPCATRVPFR